MMNDYKIKEYENGMFQVWRGDKVLLPSRLTWENDYQWGHDFMFIKSEDECIELINKMIKKEKGMEVKSIKVVDIK